MQVSDDRLDEEASRAHLPLSESLQRLIAAEQAAGLAGEAAVRWRSELLQAADAAISEPELDEFVARALSAVRDLLGSDTVSLLVTNEAGTELVARSSVGAPERVSVGVRIPVGAGMAGRVVATRQPLIIDDLSEIELASPMLRHVGVRSLVAVPVMTPDAVVGVLHAGSFRKGYFSSVDADALTLAADRLAAAMERVRLFESEREAREQAEVVARRLGHLQRLTATLSSDLTEEEVAAVVCRETSLLLGSGIAGCALWRLQADRLTLVQPEELADPIAPSASIPLEANLPHTEAVQSGKPLFIESVAELWRRYPATAHRSAEHERFALLPLRTYARTVGVLVLGLDDARPFEAAERHFLLALAEQAAQALDRSRLRAVERETVFHNEVAAKASAELSESLDFEATLERIVRLIVPDLADLVTIHLFDAEGRLSRAAIAHRDPEVEAAVREAIPEDGHPAVTAALAAAAIAGTRLVTDVAGALAGTEVPRDIQHHVAEALAPLGVRSVLLIPLLDRGRRLGVLSVVQVSDDRSFDPPTQLLLEDIASRAAVALTNSRLHSDLEQARRTERFLLDVTTAIAGASTFEEALHRLGTAAVRELGDLCLIDLLDEEGQLRRMVALHADASMQPLADLLKDHPPDPEGEHPSASVIRDRATLWSPTMPEDYLKSTTRDEPHLDTVKRLGFSSYIAAPLIAGDVVLGSLTLVAAGSGRRFDAGDVAFGERLAAQVATVVERARRYEQEHRTSQVLQSSLLPSTLPRIPGLQIAARYLPGTREAEVGGDFYDAVVLPSGSVSVVIGDVAGHDHEAAATMGHLRSALRALSGRSASPSQLMEAVAGSWDLLDFDRIATCIVCEVDVATGGITMANAGHPPPLLLSGENATYLPIAPAPPLGVPGFAAGDWKCQLGEGDILLLYTDGVIDDRSHDLDGRMRRLAELAANAPRTVDAVCDLVLEALGGDRSDDVALLTLGLN